MVVIDCPKCHKRYRLQDRTKGKKVRCIMCRNIFQVPDPDKVIETAPIETSPQKPNKRSLGWLIPIIMIGVVALMLFLKFVV